MEIFSPVIGIPNATIQLFPYAFIRTATGDFTKFENLIFKNVIFYIDKLEISDARIFNLTQEICQQLYNQISSIDNAVFQNFLLNLRRDIFNGRSITINKIQQLKDVLPSEIYDLLESLQTLKEERCELMNQIEYDFDTSVSNHRIFLRELSKEKYFRNGLIMSSQSLFQQLNDLNNKDPRKYRSKEFQIENGMLRYLTRMYFKTSPFSTFTNVSANSINPEPDNFHSENSLISGNVRLNNYILACLKTLLVENNKLNNCFHVCLNPSVTLTDNQYKFLVNYNNVESFQRIKAAGLPEIVVELIKGNGGKLKSDDLIQWLYKDYLDESPENIKLYIMKLVRMGFLFFDMEVSASSADWCSQLKVYLTQNAGDFPVIRELIQALDIITDLSGRFSDSEAEDRWFIMTKASSLLNDIVNKLIADGGFEVGENKEDYLENYKEKISSEEFTSEPFLKVHFKPENIFYEDTYSNTSIPINKESLERFTDKLSLLYKSLLIFDISISEKIKIKEFWKNKYGDHNRIPLLEFYETYFLNFKKPEKEFFKNEGNKAEDLENPFRLAAIKSYEKNLIIKITEFHNHLSQKLSGYSEEINLTKDDIAAFTDASTLLPDISCLAAFVQFYKEGSENDSVKGVVNGVFQGAGRSAGRFLHLFDMAVTDTFLQMNQPTEGKLFAEITDASYFNANIHPSLTEGEIRFPGGQYSKTINKSIPVSDIDIVEENGILQLIERTSGRVVIPVDLCLQSLSGRSHLYQLLAKFNTTINIDLTAFTDAVYEGYVKYNSLLENDYYKTCVLEFPRIVFEDNVIIKRRNWKIKVSGIPVRSVNEKDYSYFIRINQWRIKSGLPDEIFIILYDNNKINTEQSGKLRKDDYKPQYINFQSPLLVRLFEKQVERAGEFLAAEEMLPDSPRLRNFSGTHHVNETLIHWYLSN